MEGKDSICEGRRRDLRWHSAKEPALIAASQESKDCRFNSFYRLRGPLPFFFAAQKRNGMKTMQRYRSISMSNIGGQ